LFFLMFHRMKYIYIFFICIFYFQFATSTAQTTPAQPNREFRAIWLTTVFGLDWPKSTVPETQKEELRILFDKVKDANMNAVLLQVRSESDALYQSTKEPWSRWLTGTQGQDPGYDPLAFAIEEAHKRGLELHAWINPFRVNASKSTSTFYSQDHISNTRPDLILTYDDNGKIIDPGIPEGREYIASVVEELAQNYAIDGIHFDDYFYAYGGTTNEDAATYEQYGGGFTNISDWRRHNINETIRLVNEAVKAVDPGLRFGVSPFGIWKSGVPEGIVGMSAYSQIYADALHWLQNQTLDYVTPQLYWKIDGQQDFRKLLIWWAEQANSAGRHLYAGHTLNDITGPGARTGEDGMKSIAIMEELAAKQEFSSARIAAQSAKEVPNQIAIVREHRDKLALGSVLFRAAFLAANPHGFTDYLKENTYIYPAAPPVMDWLPQENPAAPVELTAGIDEATGDYNLSWNRNVANTYNFKRYLIYNLADEPVVGADIPQGSVRALEATEELVIPATEVPFGTSHWIVTELAPSNHESARSNVVTIKTAPTPVIINPTQEENAINETFARFDWEGQEGILSYHYQWADNPEFLSPLAEDDALEPSTNARLFYGLEGGRTYYFRLRAEKKVGWSEWTPTYSIAIGQVTGVSEDLISNKLRIYPNPAGISDKVVVDFSLVREAHVNAKLLSIEGKVMLNIADNKYSAGDHTINIGRSQVQSGVYLLVFNIDGNQKVKRVIFN
jgi:uncharacterized lipoprotein YddW (UPF0748 family)